MSPNATNIQFSPVIVGTMRLGSWGANMTSADLEYFIDQCLDLGLRDFDHADIYGHYTMEGMFGQVLRRRTDLRSKMQLTTKCGVKLVCDKRPEHQINSYELSPKHILASVDQSLTELGIDTIDLFLLHRPDFLMNPSVIAEAFEQIRQAGKVRFFGVSNFTPSQFDLLHSLTPLVTNQVEISLMHLAALEDGTLDQCLRHQIIPTAWSPFGGGTIFGATDDPRILRIQEAAKLLTQKHNASIDQILLAWLSKHPAGIIPVLGSSKISRLESALKAGAINLSHEEWYQLLEASRGKKVD